MSNTREQLQDRAEHYIRQGGFGSFSFRDLAKDLNIKSASVHYHFPSKSDLGTAVAERYNRRFENALPGHIKTRHGGVAAPVHPDVLHRNDAFQTGVFVRHVEC